MFYLARLISSSSHSLSATIGFAMVGVLRWAGRTGAPDAVLDAGMPPQCPRLPALPALPAATPDPGVLSFFLIERRIPWTAELF
jgi:hypothetical protein